MIPQLFCVWENAFSFTPIFVENLLQRIKYFTENLVNWWEKVAGIQLEATREEVGCGSKGARTAFEKAGFSYTKCKTVEESLVIPHLVV